MNKRIVQTTKQVNEEVLYRLDNLVRRGLTEAQIDTVQKRLDKISYTPSGLPKAIKCCDVSFSEMFAYVLNQVRKYTDLTSVFVIFEALSTLLSLSLKSFVSQSESHQVVTQDGIPAVLSPRLIQSPA